MPGAAPSLKATAARLRLLETNTAANAVTDRTYYTRLPAWRDEVMAVADAATLAALFIEFIDGTEGHEGFDQAMRRTRAAAATSLRRAGITIQTIAKHVKAYRVDVIEAGRRAWASLKPKTGGQPRSWKAKDPARQSAYAGGTHDVVAAYSNRFDARIGRDPRVPGTLTVRASKAWREANYLHTTFIVMDHKPRFRDKGAWARRVGRPLCRGKGFVVLPSSGSLKKLDQLRADGIARMGSLEVSAAPDHLRPSQPSPATSRARSTHVATEASNELLATQIPLGRRSRSCSVTVWATLSASGTTPTSC